jgi:hypothetical protein
MKIKKYLLFGVVLVALTIFYGEKETICKGKIADYFL